MKRLLIIGAGDFGREVLNWATGMQASQTDWQVGGFLDANPHALSQRALPVGVVGNPGDYAPSENDVFICGISNPADKLRACEDILARGGRFVNVIHPSVIIGTNCTLGTGNVLCPNVVLSNDAVLGRFIAINIGSSIGHDTRLEDGCTISSHCDVMGFVTLGRGCFLGSHAAILPSKTVGEFATVGACSAVVRNVEPRTTVMGVPAQLIARMQAAHVQP